MDHFTAIGLVSNIISFVDFGTSLFRGARDVSWVRVGGGRPGEPLSGGGGTRNGSALDEDVYPIRLRPSFMQSDNRGSNFEPQPHDASRWI